MPLYMDVHRNQSEASEESLREGHISDLEAQEKHGAKYLKYWYSAKAGTVCCLIDAPNREACIATHRDSHGDLADDIIEVESGMVEAFLGGEAEDDLGCALSRSGNFDSAFRTILFTDLEASTNLTQRLGDERSMDLLRTHDAIARGAIGASEGRVVKHTGDGFMASFVSATSGIQCAIAIQRALADFNTGSSEPIRVRIGLSAGEPVAENEELFGAAVQLASRVCDAADAGRIYVANVVRELCIGKNFVFEDRGEKSLKGFDEPMRVHEVVW